MLLQTFDAYLVFLVTIPITVRFPSSVKAILVELHKPCPLPTPPLWDFHGITAPWIDGENTLTTDLVAAQIARYRLREYFDLPLYRRHVQWDSESSHLL